MGSVFPAFGVIYKAPVPGVSGCGFSSNIGFSDVTHSCLCTILTFQFFQQNHFYGSAESKSGQLLWLKFYLGKKRERERRERKVFSKPNQFAASWQCGCTDICASTAKRPIHHSMMNKQLRMFLPLVIVDKTLTMEGKRLKFVIFKIFPLQTRRCQLTRRTGAVAGTGSASEGGSFKSWGNP